jgi:Na+/phosphate symporter
LEESIDFVLNRLNIAEPLMELVLLNTLLNLGGIILFFPFIGLISQFMQKRFLDKKDEPISKTEVEKVVTKIRENIDFLNESEKELSNKVERISVVLKLISIGYWDYLRCMTTTSLFKSVL